MAVASPLAQGGHATDYASAIRAKLQSVLELSGIGISLMVWYSWFNIAV